MNEKRTNEPTIPPDVTNYVHDDGSPCLYRPYWVGNVRDGHWQFAYWYADGEYWRYCGIHNGP